MRILALETSTLQGSVALLEDGAVLAELCTSEPNSHAECLSPLVARALSSRGWRPADLDLVAVGRGPGSFTGLRVGIALGQGIATALHVPVLGISSLAALASQVSREIDGVRLASVDARRGEWFLAAYAPDGTVVLPVTVGDLAALRARIESLGTEPLVVCGALGTELLREPPSPNPKTHFPSATDVARIAWNLASAPGFDPELHPATPLYVRDVDAVLPRLPPNPLEAPRSR